MLFKIIYNLAIYYVIPIIFSFLLVACQTQNQKITKRTQFVMGTLIEITTHGENKKTTEKAIAEAFSEFYRLENIMSTYKPDSELSQFNISAGSKRHIQVSTDLFKVIKRGIYWGNLSNGAMDISIGPAVKLWNFEKESPVLPSQQRIKNALSLIDYKNIYTDGSSITLKKRGVSLHLGSIGKGYAVDSAVKILKSFGIKNGLVNAGGDLMAFGFNDKSKSWRIGIQHPRKPEAVIAMIDIKDKAVATSGDYQKYFIKDKKDFTIY